MQYDPPPITVSPETREKWEKASFNPANKKPSIIKAGDRIIVATDYGFISANMIVIDSGDGLVVVDTMEGPSVVIRAKADIGALMEKPVSNIIYTHHHGDHKGGSQALANDRTSIIATQDFVDMMADYTDRLADRIRLDISIQYNIDIKPPRQPISQNSADAGHPTLPAGVNTVFKDNLIFKQGDLTFELFLAPSETVDALIVWIPELKTVCCGDMFYTAFPAISSPMKLNRSAYYWYKSIEKVLALKPELLVQGHGPFIAGKDLIQETLSNYHDAIKFVDDKVVEALNNGKSIEQLRDEVRDLPEKLRALPYLQEQYGKLSWALEGNYRYYIGWFYGNSTWLDPLPALRRSTELVNLAGGADKIVERAIALQKEGQDQLALELLDVVLIVQPSHRTALAVKANSLERLGSNSCNLNARGFYLSDSQRTVQKLKEP